MVRSARPAPMASGVLLRGAREDVLSLACSGVGASAARKSAAATRPVKASKKDTIGGRLEVLFMGLFGSTGQGRKERIEIGAM